MPVLEYPIETQALSTIRDLREGKMVPNMLQNESAVRDRAVETIERLLLEVERLTENARIYRDYANLCSIEALCHQKQIAALKSA